MFINRATNWDDFLNIYFSRLDERIIFALDDFDSVNLNELPEPTPEYFQALKKIKWEDKNTKELYKKLMDIMFEVMYFVLDYPDLGERVGSLSTYRSTEDLFILTLAGCSAVNDSRQKIEEKDVVRAYKTFFKLIKTDVTEYKAIPERIRNIEGYTPQQSEGYLICGKCNSYYQLQPDESPNDFSDTCECGGKLKYKKEL
ncbi:MAG: hypothetical protein HZC47_00675 [Methanobacterium sp.]|uniref:hypothetical protein n=1 Tax=Methanobacterium sp. TaxID=2164 RepID=UPI003D6577E1|nr:hypothetical protein [Methanobacterium sp.]